MESFTSVNYKPHRIKQAEFSRIKAKSDRLATRDECYKNRKRQQERLEARKKEVGSGKRTANLILEGSNDRINAVLYEPQKYDNDKEQGAYLDGFFRHGGNRLSANLKNLSPEDLYKIGYNDCLSGIGINTLSSAIKTNKDYLRGYRIALQSIQDLVYGPPKPKHR